MKKHIPPNQMSQPIFEIRVLDSGLPWIENKLLRPLKKPILVGIFSLSLFLFSWYSGHANPILTFEGSNLSPSVGEIITADIVISDESFTNAFYAYDLDIGYDPAFFNVVSVDPGLFLTADSDVLGPVTLSQIGLFQFDSSTPGEINNIVDSRLSIVNGVGGTGVLATVTFETLKIGQTTLNFLEVNTTGGTELQDENGLPVIVDASSLVLGGNNTEIPEPSVIAMAGAGVLFLVAVQKRRRKRI